MKMRYFSIKKLKNLKIFIKLPFEDIAFPRGVNGMDKYQDDITRYKKGTPIHTKGAILFNFLLKKYNIKSISSIQNGDKIKFIYLKTPNPLHENVIASSGTLPEEFGLQKYIDYNLQFKKTFMDPLRLITKIIKWDIEPTVKLEDFFFKDK